MSSKILLVDDNPGMTKLMSRALAGLGQVRFADGGDSALEQARELLPDLILLDAEMPGMSGFQVCAAIKADPALRDIPVIFVTSHSGPEFDLRGLEVGAVDFIAKPVSEPLLVARLATHLKMKHLNDDFRRIATVDALTGVSNRRSFDAALSREWTRGLRSRDSICLLMVDLDHFKLFNEYYGHQAGDAALRSVAQALHSVSQRPGDLVARYGGEEFALLLPQTDRPGAEHLGDRALRAVQSLCIPHAKSPTSDHVTVSVGVGYFDESSSLWADRDAYEHPANGSCTATSLLECADQALYSAKRAGRNRTWVLGMEGKAAPDLLRAPQEPPCDESRQTAA